MLAEKEFILQGIFQLIVIIIIIINNSCNIVSPRDMVFLRNMCMATLHKGDDDDDDDDDDDADYDDGDDGNNDNNNNNKIYVVNEMLELNSTFLALSHSGF